MRRWLVMILMTVVLGTTGLAGVVQAAEAEWQPFDTLGPADRTLAEGALAVMFGEDPELWPDWLEPRAVLIAAGDETLLVVRQPYRAPCGQYLFSVFGPAAERRQAGATGREFLCR